MYNNIVVPLDGSELAESVIPHVVTVAKGCDEPKITLLRVVEPIEMPYGEALATIPLGYLKQAEIGETERAEKYLNKIATKLTISGIKATVKIISGKAADAIVDYVNKNNIDLIVVATHGRSGISRWVWGSVTDRILTHVCIGVLMVRAPGCGVLLKQ